MALALLVIARAGAVAFAEEAPGAGDRKAALEAEIRAEVERVSPPAATLFDQANQARDGGDLGRALELYRKGIEVAPSVDHLHRRACGVLLRLERYADAVEECEGALRLGPESGFNQSTLAHALVLRNRPGDTGRALDLARRGAAAHPADEYSLATWCQVALQSRLEGELHTCAEKLLAVNPTGIGGNVTMSLAELARGDVDSAQRYLARARQAGLPEQEERNLSDLLRRASTDGRVRDRGVSAPSGAVLRGALLVIGVWIAVLLALLAAGWILSRITLRAVERVAASGEAAGDGTEGERGLRRIYKVVVLLCGIYFYLSVPVLLASIVVAGGGLIWVFVALGQIPIKLVLLVGLGVILTIGAILRGLFARAREAELGYRLDLAANPRFRELLDSVARTIGTRPVDSAYLTPTTEMAVTERGGLWKSLRGKAGERCLIMGVGLLDGMKQIDLRSVLGHEYGHFRNADTAGGGFALAVRRSLVTMIVRLAQSGAAAWYNPVWLFLRAYHRVYLVVSQGASRLQEVLADRWAIRAYGSQAFVRGYSHVVERSVLFEHHMQRSLREAIEERRPLPNLYRHEPGGEPTAGGDPADLVREAMEREPSAYDSHPAPRQRLAWAAKMAVERAAEPGDEEPAWDLFADRESLERQMTREVREAVAANHGVAIAG